MLLAWPQSAWLLALVIVSAGFAFGSFWTPAMSMITDEAEAAGLDYGYAFALVNIAWAPGQAGGAAIGGAVASATSDKVVYLGLSCVCLLTLLAISGYRETAAPLAAELFFSSPYAVVALIPGFLTAACGVSALFFNRAAYLTQVFPERVIRIDDALL